MFDEGVVLLSRAFSQGLEPVGVVCRTHLHRPAFHARCHLVSDFTVERGTIVHRIHQAVEHLRRQILEHLLTIEHILSEILARTFGRCGHILRLCLESLFYDSESQC